MADPEKSKGKLPHVPCRAGPNFRAFVFFSLCWLNLLQSDILPTYSPRPNPDRLSQMSQKNERLAVQPLTIYRLVQSGKLSAVRIGRSLRFDPEAVDCSKCEFTQTATP